MYGSQTIRTAVIIIILLPLSCFLVASNGSGSVQYKNDNGAQLEIPFKLDRNKVILLAAVGNSRPLKIILDSGMAMEGLLLYDKELKDSLNLIDPMDVEVQGAGKGKPSTAVMAESMSFSAGNVNFNNQRIVILQNDQFKGFPTDGVMGYSIFGNYVVEIDYDDEKIRLHDPEEVAADKSWEVLSLSFKNNRKIPWVEASINTVGSEEINVSMYIDLASGEAVELLLRDDQKFSLPDSMEDYYLGRGLSGDIYGQRGFINSYSLGSFKLTNVRAAFAQADIRSKQAGADGVIGNNLLRRFNVIFDYFNEKLYIKPNKYFEEPF